MTNMKPDKARQFYEEDEDPGEVFARFDAARHQGRLRLTQPPPDRLIRVIRHRSRPARELLRKAHFRGTVRDALRRLVKVVQPHTTRR